MFPLPIQWVILLPLLLLRLLLLLLLLLRPTLVVFAPSAAARLPALTYPAFCLSLTHLSSIVSHTLKFTAIIYAFYFYFVFFLLLFVFLTLFCLILLLWYFSLFVFCVSASSHQFCQLWLARCFVQLHYYKLIQHTPTTALPSIVCSCGCGCGYTFLGFRVAFTGPID